MKIEQILLDLKIFTSLGEGRKMIQGGGVSVNNVKVNTGCKISLEDIHVIRIGRSKSYNNKGELI